nr:ankyrin repeat-containing protein NPR4-like [Quercus suber]
MAFVKELVQLLSDDELELRNQEGETALCFAAKSGIVAIAKEMVKKNNRLSLVRSKEDRTPLHKAALLGLRDMVSYLFTVTSFEKLSRSEQMEILVATITNDMYGFKGVRSNKASMQALVHELVVLVSKVQLFEDRKYLATDGGNIIFDAAKFGNSEFLNIPIRSYPNIIWTTDKDGRSLFHIAVINRQESVFNLLSETVAAKEIILTYVMEGKNENVMHLAGYLAPLNRLNIVSGAALQMQRELLWFKGLEMIVLPSFQKIRNSDNLTPWDLFTKEHENLRRDGEKWMKDTANYCMLAATLIITVVFAAAFTVPGGSNQETGTPILLKSIWFRLFFLFDAIALLSSSTSALVFLSILTSRFTHMDFLVSLPSKLVWGLTALFISAVGVVVAFSATCFLVAKSETPSPWPPMAIVIIVSAFIPIIACVLLHFQLWADIMRSAYCSGFLFKPSKH